MLRVENNPSWLNEEEKPRIPTVYTYVPSYKFFTVFWCFYFKWTFASDRVLSPPQCSNQEIYSLGFKRFRNTLYSLNSYFDLASFLETLRFSITVGEVKGLTMHARVGVNYESCSSH